VNLRIIYRVQRNSEGKYNMDNIKFLRFLRCKATSVKRNSSAHFELFWLREGNHNKGVSQFRRNSTDVFDRSVLTGRAGV